MLLSLPKFFAFFCLTFVGNLEFLIYLIETYQTMGRCEIDYYIWKSCVYSSKKIPLFAQIFCLFWSQNRSTFYVTFYIGILPNFFAFFGAKIGAFSITYYRGILPKFFAFFRAKIGAFSITRNFKEGWWEVQRQPELFHHLRVWWKALGDKWDGGWYV